MFSSLIKNLSILKKFLFINLLIFIFIGTLTIIYLNYVQPNLIKKKTSLQIEVINNTINNLNRLKVEFEKSEVKKFLLSTRFLFQNLDRVIFFNESFEILADTDTLDLDPRSFSSRIEIVEFDLQNNEDKEKSSDELIDSKKKINLKIHFRNILYLTIMVSLLLLQLKLTINLNYQRLRMFYLMIKMLDIFLYPKMQMTLKLL